MSFYILKLRLNRYGSVGVNEALTFVSRKGLNAV